MVVPSPAPLDSVRPNNALNAPLGEAAVVALSCVAVLLVWLNR